MRVSASVSLTTALQTRLLAPVTGRAPTVVPPARSFPPPLPTPFLSALLLLLRRRLRRPRLEAPASAPCRKEGDLCFSNVPWHRFPSIAICRRASKYPTAQGRSVKSFMEIHNCSARSDRNLSFPAWSPPNSPERDDRQFLVRDSRFLHTVCLSLIVTSLVHKYSKHKYALLLNLSF